MSKTVDERVVEMRFDNKQFENNVRTTMGTLDKLKSKLKFKGAEEGFENISKAAKKTDFSPLEKGFDKSAAYIKRRIENVADEIHKLEKKAFQALTSMYQYSVDNISAGWDKFADKTKSVATLVAQGFDLETVNEQLERLNWFTDETSYNFVDMVSEIGKFTASGQDLEASVTAMEGIASWAALSGQGATKASQAMYQLSQAMGKGALKYDDWKSIQNASMDTVEFRRNAAQAAIDLGMMKQAVDEAGNAIEDYYQIVYQKDDDENAFELGGVVSLNDLFTSDYLTKEAWLDTDVMMKVFDQYGKAAKVIQKYTDSFGFDTASEAMSDLKERAEDYIKTMKAAGKDVSLDEALRILSFEDMKQDAGVIKEATEYMNEFNASVEPDKMIDLDTAIRELGYELDEFSLKAFEAGQQARSWSDVVDSVKDAVSTGWMTTFENIFGNEEEAVKLWTDLANELWDVFAASGQERNEMLTVWKQMNGRNLLFANDENHITGAFWNIYYAITDVINVVKEAFRDIFKGMDAQKLYDMTASLYFFAQKLRMTDETAAKLKSTFKGLFAAVDIVFMLIKSAADAIFKVVGSLFGKTDKSILDTTASIGDSIVAFHDWLKEGDVFGKAFDKIGEAISGAIDWVKGFIDYVRQLPAVQDTIEKVKNFFSSMVDGVDIADISIDNFGQFLELLRSNIVSGLDTISEAAKKTWEKVVEFATWAKEKLDKIGIGNIGVMAVGAALILFAKKIANATGLLDSPLEELSKLFGSLSGVLKGFTQDLKAHALIKIAGAIALLAGTIAVLVLIDPTGKSLWNAVAVLGALAAGLLAFSILLGKFGSGEFKLSVSVVAIAAAVAILVGAFAKLDEVNDSNIGRNIAIIAGLATGITVLGSIISSASKAGSKAGFAMLGMAAALLIMIHAIKKVADIETKDIVKGLVVIGVLTLYLKAVRAVFKQTKKGPKVKVADNAGLAMVGMAIAMLLMISAIKKIAAEDTGTLVKGIAVIAALSLVCALIVKVSKSSGKHASKAGLMMIEMAASLLLIAQFIKQIANIPTKDLAKAAIVATGLLAVFALVTAASKLAGENAGKAGLMMIGMSAALLAMAGVMAILTHISKDNPDGLWQAFAIVSGLIALFGALILMTKWAQDVKSTLVVLTVDLGLLAIALGALSLIPTENLLATAESLALVFVAFAAMIASTHFINTEKGSLAPTIVTLGLLAIIMGEIGLLLQVLSGTNADSALTAALGISAVLVAMSAAVWILSNAEKVTLSAIGSMAALTIIVAGLAGVMMLMSLVPIESAITNAVGISIMLEAMAGAVWILSNAEKVTLSAIGAMAALTLITAGLGAILWGMSELNVESAIVNALALSILLGAMSGAVLLLSFCGNIALSTIGAMVALDFVTAGLGAILWGMSALGVDSAIPNAIALSILLVAMSGALLILGAVGTVAASALAGLGVLAVLIIGLGAIMWGLGALFENVDGLSDTFDIGMQALEKIGYGLGSFIGNVIGGFSAGITSGFPQIGENIAKFGENIEPFLTQMSNLDGDVLTGIGVLSDMAIKLAASEFLDSINTLFEKIVGQKDVSSFSEELVSFADGIVDFAEQTKNINGYNFKNIADGALALASFANALPGHDGFVQWITGEKYLDKFGEELKSFAPNLVEYANTVNGIDQEAVQKSIDTAEIIRAFADNLPAHDGLLQWFTGDATLTSFGEELASFGPNLMEYERTVKGIDQDVVQNSIDAAEIIRAFAENLPDHGGVISWFEGDATLTTFGEELISFGPKLRAYGQMVTGLNKDVVDNSVRAAQVLAAFEKEDLSTSGGLASLFNGSQDLGAFGEKLPKLGEGLKNFSDKITEDGGINTNAVNAATRALEVLTALQNNIPEEAGFFEKIGNFFTGGNSGIDTFTNNMPKLAKGIKAFSDALMEDGGINASSVDAAANTFAALSELSKIESVPNIDTVTNKLPEIAEDLKAYSDTLTEGTGFDSSTMNEIVLSIRSLYDLENDLISTGFENTTEGINQLLKLVGLLNRISGLDLDRIDAFGDTLTHINESGLKEFLNSLNTSADNINDAALNIIDSLAKGVTNNETVYTDAIIKMADSGIQALKDKYAEYKETGKGLSNSVVEGIEENASTPETSERIDSTMKNLFGNVDIESIGKNLFGGITNMFAGADSLSTMSDAGSEAIDSFVGEFASSETIDKIKSVGSGIVTNLTEGATGNSSWLTDTASEIGSSFTDTFTNTEFVDELMTAGSEVVSDISTGVLDNVSEFTDASSAVSDLGISSLRDEYSKYSDAGKYLTEGLASGIESGSSTVVEKTQTVARNAVEAAKKELDINSPSRVFYGIGEFAGQGFINALDDYSKMSYDSGMDMADSTIDGLSSTIQRLTDYINSDIDAEPTIRPVLDLSNIDAGAEAIDGMFASQRTIDLAGRANVDMNAVSSKNQNGVIVDNRDVVSAVKELRGEMAEMADNISKLQIVLNTGALVGELASPMDTAIGVRASRSIRGRG